MSIYNERRGLWGDSVAEYYAPAPSCEFLFLVIDGEAK